MSIYATTIWDLSHRHDSFAAFAEHVASVEHEMLAGIAANTMLNNWCADVSDYHPTESDPEGHGKRLPYVGWYWRSIDFAAKDIPIGDCGDFIGFIANNKWDHPERNLTKAEADTVIDLIWRARTVASGGGNVAELHAKRDVVLTELWDFMQGLTGLERS